MPALQGVAVLVTRPEQQAASLRRLLEAGGASAIPFAALEIRPTAERAEILARLGLIDRFDCIVFTSANAVQFGAFLLPAKPLSTLAAIGPATARALDEAGFHAAVVPAAGFDSEHLLKHPQLREAAGRRVLLVKGRHGRELLQDELVRRGARVDVAEVYERHRISRSAETLAALETRLASGNIHIVTATSAEIVASLIDSATLSLRREFDRVPWVVPSGRVAAALRERGMTAPILQADSAGDHDLVAAIERWRASESGA